jgi:hypothetical protein
VLSGICPAVRGEVVIFGPAAMKGGSNVESITTNVKTKIIGNFGNFTVAPLCEISINLIPVDDKVNLST